MNLSKFIFVHKRTVLFFAALALLLFTLQPLLLSYYSDKKILISGDSTITSQACRSTSVASKLFNIRDIYNGYSATNIALGGHTINQQKKIWDELPNKTDFDIIIVQVGLNDMNTAIETTLVSYQAYIDAINSSKKAEAKVYISCMIPAKQRWIDLRWANGQHNWVKLNQAIMGGGSKPITGVNKRNDYHVLLLADEHGNLSSAYDCGDHIHENQDGADIIIKGFRKMIF